MTEYDDQDQVDAREEAGIIGTHSDDDPSAANAPIASLGSGDDPASGMPANLICTPLNPAAMDYHGEVADRTNKNVALAFKINVRIYALAKKFDTQALKARSKFE